MKPTLFALLATAVLAIPYDQPAIQDAAEPALLVQAAQPITRDTVADLFDASIIDAREAQLESRDEQLATLAPLATRQLSGSSVDNLVDGTPCRAVTVIFARGTFEGGDIGAVVGPQFLSSLQSAIGAGNVAMQGIAYPANVNGYFAGGDAVGATNMTNYVNYAFNKCPNTKVVMSGYSQGAQVVHKAATQLGAATMSKVTCAVLFGDPDNGQAVAGLSAAHTKVFCDQADPICYGLPFPVGAHLTYANSAPAAAAFVKQQTGF